MKKIIKWKDKTKGEKTRIILYWVFFIIFLAGTIMAFIYSDQIFGELSVFNKTISDNTFLNFCYSHIPSVIRSIQIIVLGMTLNFLLKLVMKICIAHTKKGITITQILASFLKWAIAILVVLVILNVWGVDTTTLVASAGVLTLVIGLGAQSLIADIVAGVFIVFEDEYEVGDIIVLDGWRGTVVEVGIRTTKIQDAGGNIKIVNNSEIKAVINQTKENSVAKCYININYEEDMDKVEQAINKDLKEVSKKLKNTLGDIEYKGISEFSSSGVTLFFIARCRESDIYQIQRDMNKLLKQLLENNGIGLSYQNLVIHTPEKPKKK